MASTTAWLIIVVLIIVVLLLIRIGRRNENNYGTYRRWAFHIDIVGGDHTTKGGEDVVEHRRRGKGDRDN